MIRKVKREIRKTYLDKTLQNSDQVIEVFKDKILLELGQNLKGIYIIGSIGMNDFNQHLSDIDFIVTTEKQLSQKKIKEISRIHIEIENEVLQPNLNGIYILENDVGKNCEKIESLTYFDEGELRTVVDKADYYAINPITWTELKLLGVTVYGKSNDDFDIKIDWFKVDKYLHQNINTYWKNWLRQAQNPLHPYFYMTLLRKNENAWCVSGVARQLYTLKEGQIASKKEACEYFINKVPTEFVEILADTIKHRKGQKARASWIQKKETLRFLEYCINNFNSEYQEKHSRGHHM